MRLSFLFEIVAVMAVCIAAPVSNAQAEDAKGLAPTGDATVVDKPTKPKFESFTEELKKNQEELKPLLEQYKANPTDENKAKIRAKISEKYDAKIRMRESQLEKLNTALESIKKSKDSDIDKELDGVISGKVPSKPKADPSGKDASAPIPPSTSSSPSK